MKTKTLKYHLLQLLLHQLEAEGHRYGVDKHLQLQQLLDELGEDYPVERLKTILCPLLTGRKAEQKAFYDTFNECLKEAKVLQNTKEELPVDTSGNTQDKRWKYLIAALVLSLFGLLIWVATKKNENDIEKKHIFHQPHQTLYDFESKIISGDSLLANINQHKFLQNNGIDSFQSEKVSYEMLDSTQLKLTAVDTLGLDSISIMLYNAQGDSMRWEIITDVAARPSVKIDTTSTELLLFVQKELPYPSHIDDFYALEIQPPTEAEIQFYAWLPWLKALALLLLTTLLWAIMRWLAFRRRKLVASIEQGTRPPYIWDIKFADEARPAMGENFLLLLNRMRQRIADEGRRFDIPKTIDATVAKGGMVNFQYQQQSRPPEYILLIDRQSSRNHRAQYFDLLYQAFKEEEVLINRFYYKGDIRLCFNEEHPDGIHLQDLAQKHPNTRLMIVGSAHAMLSPMTGRLTAWTNVVKQWKERILFSPLPVEKWGKKERELDQLFNLLPASIQGLQFFMDESEAGAEADYTNWKEKIKDAPTQPITLNGGLIESLRNYYSEDLLQWIAACAVYPKLHFEFTCQLGRLLSTPDKNLLTLKNLSEINRLPWFVEGIMPPMVRALLLEYLEAENPQALEQSRAFLHESMAANKPPEGSVAATEHTMQMAMNEWLFTKDKTRKKALEKEIAQLLAAGVEADFIVVKELEKERSPLDVLVPESWKKHLYRGGYPALGLRGLAKDVFWALPVFLAAAVAAFWYQPVAEECVGDVVVYEEKSLCLDTPADYALYVEQLTLDAIEDRNLARLDSLVIQAGKSDGIPYINLWGVNKSLKEEEKQLNAALQRPYFANLPIYNEYKANVATALYNQGTNLYLESRDSACLYFTRAIKVDSLNTDYQSAVRWCKDENQPIASFAVDQTACCVPCTISFANTSSINVIQYRWIFKKQGGNATDIQTSINASPTHTFEKVGKYTITLIASNASGRDSISQTIEIKECLNTTLLKGQVLDSKTQQPIATTKQCSGCFSCRQIYNEALSNKKYKNAKMKYTLRFYLGRYYRLTNRYRA